MNTALRISCFLLLLPACLLSTGARGERLFKWVDDDGQVHYTNRLPPEAAKHERRIINEQGRTLKVYSAPLTPEQKAEKQRLEALEKRRRELAEKRAIHDRSLLATYSNTQDMEAAMQGRVASVESMIKLTNSRVKSMQGRLLELTEEAASYERSGKPLPDKLQTRLANLRGQIEHNKAFVVDKKLEIEDIRLQFQADIRRYEELTSQDTGNKQTEQPPSALQAAQANPDIRLSRRDRTLLASYASEEDLLFARDEEISHLNAAINDAAGRLDTLQTQLGGLSENIDRYQSRDEIPPDRLVERMKETMRDIAETQKSLDEMRSEKQSLDDRFARDIARFRKLTASND